MIVPAALIFNAIYVTCWDEC